MQYYINKYRSGNSNGRFKCIMITLLVLFSGIRAAHAQLTDFQTGYFQNQYLTNPAMAGLDRGLNLNMGYQRQWNTLPGGPKLENLTADYQAGNHVGLGLNVNSEQAGLTSRTRVMGTYAYHLQVSSEGQLHFGLSLGINNTFIDFNKLVGDQGDASAQNYNLRKVYVDGDLGIAYTGKALTLQAALPNLKNIFFKNKNENLGADRSTFFTAVSYKIPLNYTYSNLIIEPKAVLRGINGYQNIVDVGGNLLLTSYHFNLTGMYHSNKSATVGVGLDLKTINLLFSYTNYTGPFSSYADNTFELGCKLKLFNK